MTTRHILGSLVVLCLLLVVEVSAGQVAAVPAPPTRYLSLPYHGGQLDRASVYHTGCTNIEQLPRASFNLPSGRGGLNLTAGARSCPLSSGVNDSTSSLDRLLEGRIRLPYVSGVRTIDLRLYASYLARQRAYFGNCTMAANNSSYGFCGVSSLWNLTFFADVEDKTIGQFAANSSSVWSYGQLVSRTTSCSAGACTNLVYGTPGRTIGAIHLSFAIQLNGSMKRGDCYVLDVGAVVSVRSSLDAYGASLRGARALTSFDMLSGSYGFYVTAISVS
jgi:hypothetical protein